MAAIKDFAGQIHHSFTSFQDCAHRSQNGTAEQFAEKLSFVSGHRLSDAV